MQTLIWDNNLEIFVILKFYCSFSYFLFLKNVVLFSGKFVKQLRLIFTLPIDEPKHFLYLSCRKKIVILSICIKVDKTRKELLCILM